MENTEKTEPSLSITIGFLIGSLLSSVVPALIGIVQSFFTGFSSGTEDLKKQVVEMADQPKA